MFNTQSQTQFASSLLQSNFPQINSKPTKSFRLNPSNKPKTMFRNITRRLSSTIPPNPHSFRFKFTTFWAYSKNPIRSEKLALKPMFLNRPSSIRSHPERNLFEMGQILARNRHELCAKRFASMAEAVANSSTDENENEDVNGGDEVEKLLSEMGKQERRQATRGWWRQKRAKTGSSWNYLKLKRRQVKIETEAWEQAAKEYKELLSDMCEKNLAPNLPYMKSLFLGWFEPLCKRIGEDQELCRKGKHKAAYAPYFDLLPAEKMGVITMHKVMGLIMTGGENGCARVVAASCSVGEAIEQEIRIHKFLEKTKTKKAAKDAKTEEKVPDIDIKEREGLHKKVTNLMKKQKLQAVGRIVKDHDDSKPWTQAVKAQVGSRLIELLLQSAYIQPPADQSGDMPPDIRPAFVHTFRTSVKGQRTGRRYGVIECDPSVRKGLERSGGSGGKPQKDEKLRNALRSSGWHVVIPYMPMLIPPVKWTGYDKGAYLFLPSFIMRIHGAKQQREVLKRTPKENLQPVFEALDTLGNTKWRVNKRVLAVVDRIWSDGGRIAGLVDRHDVLSRVPNTPLMRDFYGFQEIIWYHVQIPLPEEPDTEDEEQRKKWKWKVKKVKKENKERHSQRCDIELKLTVARKMRDEAGFFYPHNLDFRGRAYPMHPYLNHLGSDLCRGILEFAEGRPIGSSGLRWLKIHLANLFAGGVDKLSLDGRIAFTESHLHDIFDSADQPLDGDRWWLNAEDPFQCLAVCIHLAEALRSRSPETTISYIPVHQDGSCNGLQHYAALGRDKLGASAVNLVKGERPADVYSGIAARVLDIVKRDAQLDPASYPDAKHARLLINQVDRKLVKQTVMTSVYGVTYIGARDQIKKRLQERSNIADDAELFGAACYAAKITLAALGEMFEGARNIMNWLGDCAKLIASENEPVRWTTPLGLPVVQPYRMYGRHLVSTSLQVLTLQRETEKVMVRRQRTAFPPNFVHSLDGSHMMMTAVACKRAGLNFAGVHDSYWTHACDVDEMNRILREKFVELYQTPVLENLLESFERSFPTLSFPPLPDRGDFDLSDVLQSSYFFN